MNWRYLKSELYHRRQRTLTAILSLAIGIALLIGINALSKAYSSAARVPLKEIGADVTVQRAGDVPQELTGPVFACSAVTIRKKEVDRIRNLEGISGLGQALLVWVFDTDRFTIVLGLDPENPVGPGVLRTQVTDGKFFEKGQAEAVLETSFAENYGLHTGDMITVAGKTFPVVGIVDASRASKIAVANIYLPLQTVQKMAAASKQVQKVSPFKPQDVNILFIKAKPGHTDALARSINEIMGKKVTVATPQTFLKRLGSLFALSDKFALIISLIAAAVTVLVVFKTMAGNLAERAREIGILKAVGWSNGDVIRQITAESITQCLIGGIFGIILSLLIISVLGLIEVNIPIPWDMSPSPHFLPGGGAPIFKTLRLPVYISWRLAGMAVLVSVIIAALSAGLLSRHISRIKPSEVLRYE